MPVFFFNDTATTEIYTLSLHDALPILYRSGSHRAHSHLRPGGEGAAWTAVCGCVQCFAERSEEHSSELQSQSNLVCRLLLEKKNITHTPQTWSARTGYTVRTTSARPTT